MKVVDEQDLKYQDDNLKAPTQHYKQRQALPPNYVHSLDSTHMLRTATACRLAGLNFAAVHDSYWTHARDTDMMNAILRDEFVALHESTDLARLYDEMRANYSCKLGLESACPGYDSSDAGPCKHSADCRRVRWERLEDDPPATSELDLSVVRDSTYFFS